MTITTNVINMNYKTNGLITINGINTNDMNSSAVGAYG